MTFCFLFLSLTEPFFKFAYLASCYRPDVKYGIKKGEAITWPGTNSSKETFEEDLLKFKQGLKARRYPENIMEWSLSGVSFASRQSFLARTQKLKGHQRLLWRGTRGGRGQEAGEQGAGCRIYMRAGSGSRNKEDGSLLFITGYYLVKNTHLLKF